MPRVEVSEEQILRSLDELSPRARREALRRLLASVDYLDALVERNRSRVEAMARQRGLEWATLSEDQREALIDEVLHGAPTPRT